MRLALSGLAVLLMLLVDSATPAQAEFYLSLFAGGSFPLSEDVEADLTIDTGVGTRRVMLKNLELMDVKIENSFLYGGKAGYFFESRVLGGNVGLELEAYRFHPNLLQQSVSTSPTFIPFGFFGGILVNEVVLEKSDLDVTGLALNALYRRSFGGSPRFPHGRLQVYTGPGMGMYIGHLKTTTSFLTPQTDIEDTRTEMGFQAVGGLKYFLTRHVGLFGEYRFVQTGTFDFQFEKRGTVGFSQGMEKLDLGLDLTDNQVYGGVAFHF